jgi:hypothetical protein
MPNKVYERVYLKLSSIYIYRVYCVIKTIRSTIGIQRKHKKITSIPIYLTSYGVNILNLAPVIRSLKDQTYAARDINLVVSYADKKKYSRELSNLKVEGVTLHVTEDFKSHKKYIVAVLNNDYPFITVDDDIIYPSDLVENFYLENQKYPKEVLTNQARLMKKNNGLFDQYSHFKRVNSLEDLGEEGCNELLQIGAYGVFYPQGSLFHDVKDIEKAISLTETGDDIWLKVQSKLNGVKVRLVRKYYVPFACNILRRSKEVPLNKRNITGGKNDDMLNNVLKEYKVE